MRFIPGVAFSLLLVCPPAAHGQSFLVRGSYGPTVVDSGHNFSYGIDPGHSVAAASVSVRRRARLRRRVPASLWPAPLPDGRRFAVLVWSGNVAEQGVFVASLDNASLTRVSAVQSPASVLAGHLVAFVSAVRAEIGHIDRQLAIESIATMADRVAEMVAPRRFSAMVLGGFATGSLLLAALGLYGLLVFTVGERAREIAVRLALGAQRAEILRMVMGQGLRLVAFGLVLGVAISYGVGRAIGSLLYQTESHDIVTFGTVPVVLLLIAVIACALPAYRASRVEPMGILRLE